MTQIACFNFPPPLTTSRVFAGEGSRDLIFGLCFRKGLLFMFACYIYELVTVCVACPRECLACWRRFLRE